MCVSVHYMCMCVYIQKFMSPILHTFQEWAIFLSLKLLGAEVKQMNRSTPLTSKIGF